MKNVFCVSDESFEVDLDDNFHDARNILEMLKIEGMTASNYLMKPQDRANEGNENAYDENEYGDSEEGSDEDDIF